MKAMNFQIYGICSLFVMSLLGCNRVELSEVSLSGPYSISFYEAVPNDRVYILLRSQVFVPPDVELISVDDPWIAGYLHDIEDPAFAKLGSGYFTLNVESGDLTTGLEWNDVATSIPGLERSDLIDTRSYWPKRSPAR